MSDERQRGTREGPPGAFAPLHGDVAMRAAWRRQEFVGLGDGREGPVPQQAEHGAGEREGVLVQGMVQSAVTDFDES